MEHRLILHDPEITGVARRWGNLITVVVIIIVITIIYLTLVSYSFFISVHHRLLDVGFLVVAQLLLVILRIDTQRLQLVSRQPLPEKFSLFNSNKIYNNKSPSPTI